MSYQRKLFSRILPVGTLLIGIMLVPSVYAETAQVIEEIVVTAQKREQSLRDVPITVQAVTEDALMRSNVRDLTGLMNLTPGVAEGSQLALGQKRFAIRGVSQVTGDATVGYYIGDAAIWRPTMTFAPYIRPIGLNRVEIIKGPQSTLYGNGAMGGVMRFIPKEPNLNEIEVDMRLGYSQTKSAGSNQYVDASLSVPLVEDKAAVRLTGSWEERDGWQVGPNGEDDYGDDEISDLRLQFLAEPTDKLSISFLGVWNELDTVPGTLLVENDPPTTYNTTDEGFSDAEYEIFSATIEYEFESAFLTSTSTVYNYEDSMFASPFLDLGGFGFVFPFGLADESETFNNETRLVSAGDGPFDWVLGVFYTDAELDRLFTSPFVPPAPAAVTKSESISVFGEVSYTFDNNVTVLAGLRYFEDDRSIEDPGLPEVDDTFDSVNPRFNVSYTPTDNALYFFDAAKGFRSGLFNSASTCATQLFINPQLPCETSIDSDEVWTYELGTKQTFADRGIVFEASLYYSDWSDAVVAVRPGGAVAAYTIGQVEMIGIDYSITFVPRSVEGLRLFISGNWNESEVKDVNAALQSALPDIQEGDQFQSVPPWMLSAGLDYQRMISGNMLGTFSLTYAHRDAMNGSIGTPAKGDSRDLLSMRAGIEFERFGIYLVGSNMLNEDSINFAQEGAGYIPAVTIDRPREIGLELTLNL